MEIKREIYLNRLIGRRQNGMVKVITGMRRCGKSYLLHNLFMKHLLESGVGEDSVIFVDLDNYENRELREPRTLYSYIKEKLKPDCVNYILLDEVQLVENFEEILNGLLNMGGTDVYVTGSNAKFLSKDIITEFRGRGDEVKMYPLSFSEYMSVYDGNYTKGFDEFMLFGSLPQILLRPDEEQKMSFLRNLFEETYLRDIINRYDIRYDSELEELISIVSSSVGSLTNPNKIANTFKSVKHTDISQSTIKNYLDYLCDSFLIERSKRYDIKGKNYIDTPYKYYFADTGLRNARLNFSQTDRGHLMENVIYNELRIRGYNVDVGVVPIRHRTDDGINTKMNLEVDFVCNLGNKRYYVQSAYRMYDDEKLEQERASLKNVNDSFKKIIVTGDDIHIRRDDSGITIMSVYDFLLNDNSLEM
ncbi:MAG: ATP-binding protein [Bacteroidales bacterium]|nr:ATP-binding protein [Bacteroidales bacterium]